MYDLPQALSTLYLCLLASLLGYAAWRDVATRTIPDTVSVSIIVLGAAIRLNEGWTSLGASLVVASVLFLVLIPLCSRGVLGGADLKLIAALAVGLPPQATPHLLLAVTAIGGVLAALYLLAGKLAGPRGRSSTAGRRSVLLRMVAVEFWRIRRRASLPYGVAIAIGAAVVVLQQPGV